MVRVGPLVWLAVVKPPGDEPVMAKGVHHTPHPGAKVLVCDREDLLGTCSNGSCLQAVGVGDE
jgi:hypothetical protein